MFIKYKFILIKTSVFEEEKNVKNDNIKSVHQAEKLKKNLSKPANQTKLAKLTNGVGEEERGSGGDVIALALN